MKLDLPISKDRAIQSSKKYPAISVACSGSEELRSPAAALFFCPAARFAVCRLANERSVIAS
jgi:hypothetical protein